MVCLKTVHYRLPNQVIKTPVIQAVEKSAVINSTGLNSIIGHFPDKSERQNAKQTSQTKASIIRDVQSDRSSAKRKQ